jgi:NADH dehydrogenase
MRRGEVRVTVVDHDNFQCFHGLVPEMLTGKIQPTDVLSPARRLFAPATFVNAEIEKVDLEAGLVTVGRLLDGRRLALGYDHLVLALGTTDNLGRFPGLAEHAFRLRTYSGCLAVRNHLISMLELADMERDPEERRRLLTFVVVGGNFAGVEVAGEFRECLPELAKKHFPNIPADELKVVLVVPGDHVLPELRRHQPGLIDYAGRELAKDPILEIRYGARLTAATRDEAILNDTERVPTRSIISCAGMATNPLLEALDLPKNERGRLRADRHARVEGHTAIWTGGDCGGVPLEGGGEAPALAIWAMTVGALIGRNILGSIRGRKLLPYRFNGLGDACVLGHRKAVAHLKGIQMRGFLAWVVWRVFMIYYLPSPEKRVRVVWGWLMASIFGRDIINLRVHQPLDLAPLLYEPGQDIVREGDVGTSLFIIQDGEVEVYRGGPDGPVLATLGKGQHFGEIAVFERCERTASVRAKTRVKLLQVRREAAVALSEALPVAGETLRSKPGEPVPA